MAGYCHLTVTVAGVSTEIIAWVCPEVVSGYSLLLYRAWIFVNNVVSIYSKDKYLIYDSAKSTYIEIPRFPDKGA